MAHLVTAKLLLVLWLVMGEQSIRSVSARCMIRVSFLFSVPAACLCSSCRNSLAASRA
jgi:hypothetical protein